MTDSESAQKIEREKNPLDQLFKAKKFDDLTAREIYEIARARQEIFLMEQNIICRDLDGVDYDALHCFIEEGGRVVAYLRAYRSGGEVKIGRVLTISHGIGHGRLLMEKSMAVIRDFFGCEKILLHSQCQAEEFYLKLGFCRCSDVFLEEGIEHVEMEIICPKAD